MSKSNVTNLLDAIKRKTPAQESQSPAPADIPVPPKHSRVGRPVQFWMHEEDRRILRELSAWLAGQGVRASDSLVIRTALRAAKTGNDLLQAYHEAAQLDGRLKGSQYNQQST